MNADIKITVLKRTLTEGLVGTYTDYAWQPCERLQEGQEFVSTGANMPEGFCSWAWSDIQKYVLTLARGGNLIGPRPGTFVTCCTDGFRPVIFALTRVAEEDGAARR